MLYRNTAGYIDASMVVIATGAALTAGTVYAFVRRASDSKWLQANLSWNAVKPTTTAIPTMTHVSGGAWKLAHTPADQNDTYFVNCIDSGATCYPDNSEMQVLPLIRHTTPAYLDASMVVIATGAALTAGTVSAYVRRMSDDKWLQADLSWNAVKPVGAAIPAMTHVSGGEWNLAIAAAAADDIYFVNCIDSGATCYPDNYQVLMLDLSPGDPRRRQILAALAARLATITTANGYRTDVGLDVHEWETAGLDPNESALRVEYRDEAGTTAYSAVGEHLHTLPVTLRVTCKDNTAGAALTTVRDALADIYQALYLDISFGGLAQDTGQEGSIKEDKGVAADTAAGAEVTYVIEYTTVPGTP